MAPSKRDIFKTSTSLPPQARKLRGKKKRTPFEWLALFCFALLAIFTLFVLLMRIEAFQIQKIEVVGAEIVPESEIREIAQKHLEGYYFLLIPKRNLFFYPKREIASELFAKYSRLETVDISAGFDRTLLLVADERSLAYLVCKGELFSLPCFAADAGGYLFDTAPAFSQALVPLYAGTNATGTPLGTVFMSRSEFERTDGIKNALFSVFKKNELALEPLGIELTDEKDYALVFGAGEHHGRILFRDGSAESLARMFGLVLANPAFRAKAKDFSEIEKIDLRFGKKVYYSFTGMEPEESSASSTPLQ